MPSNRGIIFSYTGLLILTAAFVVYVYAVDDREQVQIRARYTQMSLALSTGDTNTARALIAPQFRPRDRHLAIRKSTESKIIDQSFRAYSIRLPGAYLPLQDFARGSRD